MNRILNILLIVCAFQGNAQTISPQVINSAGKEYTTNVNGVYFADNIGEPFTETIGPNSNILITQGFLQPFSLSPLISGEILKSDVSCTDKKDGVIKVNVNCNISGYSVKYIWNPSTVCPDSSCSMVDSLKPGQYKVSVRIRFPIGTNYRTDTSLTYAVNIRDEFGPCKVKIYNAVTLNSDGVNDFWYIDNIDEFPNNRVQIYSRWGKKVFDKDAYNNKDKCWPEKENTDYLSGTYFYVIDLGDGSALIKGWVELIKN